MSSMSPLVGFLAGAALVGGAWVLVGSGPPGERPSAPDDPLDAGAFHAGADHDARLARIERRLDGLLAAVEQRGVPVSEGPALAVPGGGGEASDEGTPRPAAEQPVITDEVLDKTIERMRARRFAKMTAQQMRAEAHRLIRQVKDMNGAKDVLERLLARDLASDERGQVLTDLGSVHRSLQDYEASERVLRDAMRTAGMDSETGIKAGYHLIWTHSAAKQPDRGLALADELIANRSAPDGFKPWLRWAGARMAYDSGDRDRARRDYEALLVETGDRPQYRQIARDANAKLKELDDGPR